MEEYNKTLTAAFSETVRRFNKFQLAAHSKDNLASGKTLMSESIATLNMLRSHIQSLETLLSDCQDYIEEIENDLSRDPPDDDFVFQTTDGMLSYKGRDFVQKVRPVKEKIVKEQPKSSKISRIMIPEIGCSVNLACVSSLKQIPPLLNYYDSPDDKKNAGVYCCLYPGVYIKVPFPMVVDSTKDYSRMHSIRCKYGSRALCDDQRNKMAQYHNSGMRSCNFAHTGEQLIKIGYPSRCSVIPRFGNPETIMSDVKLVGINEIKNILLYGLNDLMSVAVWLDYNKIADMVFQPLEIA